MLILPNGKIINYNNNLYYGTSNIQVATNSQINNLQSQITNTQGVANNALIIANNASQCIVGSYTGGGTNTRTLTFTEQPKIIFIIGNGKNLIAPYGCAGVSPYPNMNSKIIWSSNIVTIQASSSSYPDAGMDMQGVQYFYSAIL